MEAHINIMESWIKNIQETSNKELEEINNQQ